MSHRNSDHPNFEYLGFALKCLAVIALQRIHLEPDKCHSSSHKILNVECMQRGRAGTGIDVRFDSAESEFGVG